MYAPPTWTPIAILGVLALASFLRGRSIRRGGAQVFGFGHNAHIQQAVQVQLAIIVGMAGLVGLIHWLASDWERALGRPSWVELEQVRWTGCAPMLLGLLIVLLAQANMGASLRVGVPAAGPGPLVAGGLFRISRNPIFLGLLIVAGGMFLFAPSMLSAAVLMAGTAIVSIQVRIEEDALLEIHGEAYRAYLSATPRWIWPLG